MATARNIVLAGEYAGSRIFRMSATLVYISGTMTKSDDIYLTPEFVRRYEIMTDEIIKSGNSLLLTGELDPGCLQKLRLRASEAMQKKGIYTIALKFENESRSLIEIDEKLFRAFEARMNG